MAQQGLRLRLRARLVAAALAVFTAAFAMAACGGGEGDSSPANVDLTLPSEPFSQALLSQGAEVHRITCAVCHGRSGEGGIGPALTGVTTRLDISGHMDVVLNGRGQMQAFRALLDPDDIAAVVAYQRDTFG